MGALAMASALEVDTESGPNKIQVAAQPGNAGVVSKTIKLATAAGVSAMAVDAINKLGAFETSPSGDDDCEQSSGGVCVLCKPGLFLTTSGQCEKECPPMTESPIWCPYQYCVLKANKPTAQAACRAPKKATGQTKIQVFQGQCTFTADDFANSGTVDTCTYCQYADNNGKGIEEIDCRLNDPAPVGPYNMERVSYELANFVSAKYSCPPTAGMGNCIKSITLRGEGFTELTEDVAKAVEVYAPGKGDAKSLETFIYRNNVGEISEKAQQCLAKTFSNLADKTGNTITITNTDKITTLKTVATEAEAAEFKNVEEILLTGASDLPQLAKLPKWLCKVPLSNAGGRLNVIDFRTQAATSVCDTVKNFAGFSAGGGAIPGCNAGSANTCCNWDTPAKIAAGCAQVDNTNIFE